MTYRVEYDPETGEPRPIYTAVRLTQEEMRDYVLGLLDGRYFPSVAVQGSSDLGMVFMPLAMGGLSPDSLYEKFLGTSQCPETVLGDPPKPEHPGYANTVSPEPPAKPVLIKPHPQKVSDYEWEEIDEEEYQQYLKGVEAENQALIREWEEASFRWIEDLNAYDDARRQIDAKHAEALEQWRNELAEHAEREAAREAQATEWQKRRDRIFSRWAEEIGVLVGDMKKTFPRSYNGYPIFWEFRVIHPDDWKRIDTAARREAERLEKLEV